MNRCILPSIIPQFRPPLLPLIPNATGDRKGLQEEWSKNRIHNSHGMKSRGLLLLLLNSGSWILPYPWEVLLRGLDLTPFLESLWLAVWSQKKSSSRVLCQWPYEKWVSFWAPLSAGIYDYPFFMQHIWSAWISGYWMRSSSTQNTYHRWSLQDKNVGLTWKG